MAFFRRRGLSFFSIFYFSGYPTKQVSSVAILAKEGKLYRLEEEDESCLLCADLEEVYCRSMYSTEEGCTEMDISGAHLEHCKVVSLVNMGCSDCDRMQNSAADSNRSIP